MPSTYSPDLRIELIANGEQSGVWGNTTNNNLGVLIEDAISGAALRTTSVQKYPLLAANGSADEARCAILVLDTTYVGAGNYEVYAPPVTKLYVVRNASSTKDLDLYCATAVNGTTAAGAAYTIPIGKTAFVRSNGTQFFDATDYVAGSVSFTDAVLTTPSLAGETFSTAASVVAGTNLQGQGALTADYNIVTSTAANPSGVTLPTATTGRRIIIVNKGTNSINVFPATGAAIDALSTNASISIPVSGIMMFNAASTTRWYSSSSLTLTDPLITTPSLVAAKVSTTANITAGSNTQGQGALTSDYNVITTAGSNPSGVTLPTATVGRKVLIVNKGANAVNVYPATGAAIDALGANAAISLPVGGLLEFNASSTTQWYSSFNATTAGSAGSVSFTGTAPIANQVVTYASTTGTSITTGYIYEFKATSAGQAQLRLYEDADSAGTNYVAIQPPASLASNYTLTLPTTDGNANEFLQTDGAGVLSWAAGGGGSGTVTSVASGNGMNFTTITGTGTVTMGTPSAITSTSTNSLTATSHTHAITGGAFLAGSQTFTGAKTFTGGITSAAYNFTSNDSIFGGTNFITLSTGGVSRIDLNASEFTPSPGRDNQISSGTASSRYSVIYAATGTINTSDANTKQDIADLDDAEKRVAVRIKGLIKKFRMKDAVAKKGDAARIHVGVIAQEVQDAFIAEGLDPTRYALFCSDTWWEQEEMVEHPPTKEMRMTKKIYKEPTEGATEVTRLGVRYEQLLAFVIAAM